jgi:hypothetical protein
MHCCEEWLECVCLLHKSSPKLCCNWLRMEKCYHFFSVSIFDIFSISQYPSWRGAECNVWCCGGVIVICVLKWSVFIFVPVQTKVLHKQFFTKLATQCTIANDRFWEEHFFITTYKNENQTQLLTVAHKHVKYLQRTCMQHMIHKWILW